MKNLRFRYAAAKNFLCFGPNGVEINFENYGNIVLIRGENLDAQINPLSGDEQEIKAASNGVGKSSVPEILVYTLYGKTIKKPKKISHKDVICNLTGKKLETEVIWDKYRVIRTRKPDSLRIWESEEGEWTEDTEITLGGMPATQKLIEDKLGLSYEAFVNIVIFTDDNTSSFLECDTPEKRQIVESLLSLDKYRAYSDNAKACLKDVKDSMKILTREYEMLLTEKQSSEARVIRSVQQEKDWKIQKLAELNRLAAQLKAKKEELGKSDHGAELLAWEDAQEKLPILRTELETAQAKQTKLAGLMDEARQKMADQQILERQALDDLRAITSERVDIEADIAEEKSFVENSAEPGPDKCDTCWGTGRKDYVAALERSKQNIFEWTVQVGNLVVKEELAKKKYDAAVIRTKSGQATIQTGQQKQQTFSQKIAQLTKDIGKYAAVREPHADSRELVIEEQIKALKEAAVKAKGELEGDSPFKALVEAAKAEANEKSADCAKKENDIKAAEDEQPYYEYWVKAFGDTGIRKLVIDGVLPSLNSRIAYWLQFLHDNKIELTFDNEFEATIRKDRGGDNPYLYHVLSNGQRRRLCLAVSQGWAYVRMLNAGVSTSVVFLDEVTTNIDPAGVQGIYNMVCELAKEKQVFVTTHDQELLSLLHGCDRVNLRMKDGVTELVA